MDLELGGGCNHHQLVFLPAPQIVGVGQYYLRLWITFEPRAFLNMFAFVR